MKFPEKVKAMMRQTGKSYEACCRVLGSHGGKARARRVRRIHVHQENLRRQHLD